MEFAQARYYSAIQGRFTSPDPLISSADILDPQSWNRYSYVGNRPLGVTDPTGLKWFYNKKTSKYGWCDCNVLSQTAIDEGWTEIAGLSGSGDILYKAANGAWILLPSNSAHWRNLSSEIMDELRLRNIQLAKAKADEVTTNLIFEFYSISIGYGLSMGTGGFYAVAKEFVIDQAIDAAGKYLGGSDDVQQAGLVPYQVGIYSELKALEEAYDGLDIHHVPQGHAAGQVIPGYNYKDGPAIALPEAEHDQIPNRRGTYSGTGSELIKEDMNKLKNHTNTPAGARRQLRGLIRKVLKL